MKSQSVLAVALAAFLCCGVRAVSATQLNTGPVVMTTTGGANSITVDVSIADNGVAPGCTYFLIARDGAVVAFFPRQLGVQNTLSFTDTNVVPNRTYFYDLRVSISPVPVPSPACDAMQVRVAFGSTFGIPIYVPGHVGTEPVAVAYGKLVETEEPGYTGHKAYVELCGGGGGFYFYLPPGYEQYVGQDVLMYGEWTHWDMQFGWFSTATSFALLPCAPVATQNTTWGHVKSLYR